MLNNISLATERDKKIASSLAPGLIGHKDVCAACHLANIAQCLAAVGNDRVYLLPVTPVEAYRWLKLKFPHYWLLFSLSVMSRLDGRNNVPLNNSNGRCLIENWVEEVS